MPPLAHAQSRSCPGVDGTYRPQTCSAALGDTRPDEGQSFPNAVRALPGLGYRLRMGRGPARSRRRWQRCAALRHIVEELLGDTLPSPLRAEPSPLLGAPKLAEETTVQLTSRRTFHVSLDEEPLLGLPKGASPFHVPPEDRANRFVRIGANACAEVEPGGSLHDWGNGWAGRKMCRPAPNLGVDGLMAGWARHGSRGPRISDRVSVVPTVLAHPRYHLPAPKALSHAPLGVHGYDRVAGRTEHRRIRFGHPHLQTHRTRCPRKLVSYRTARGILPPDTNAALLSAPDYPRQSAKASKATVRVVRRCFHRSCHAIPAAPTNSVPSFLSFAPYTSIVMLLRSPSLMFADLPQIEIPAYRLRMIGRRLFLDKAIRKGAILPGRSIPSTRRSGRKPIRSQLHGQLSQPRRFGPRGKPSRDPPKKPSGVSGTTVSSARTRTATFPRFAANSPTRSWMRRSWPTPSRSSRNPRVAVLRTR